MEVNTKTNRLTLICEPWSQKSGKQNKLYGLFRCDCGTEKTVSLTSVKTGHAKSCGCIAKEKAANICISRNKKYNEDDICQTKLYKSWNELKKKCKLYNFEMYVPWLDFLVFRAWAENNGYLDGLCLYRKDTNITFCPDNCYYIEKKELAKTILQSHSCKEKVKQTSLVKYGVESPILATSVIEKAKNTHLRKYGCRTPFELDSIQSQVKDTLLQKYGVSSCQQIPEIKNQSIQTCIEKYGRFPVCCKGASKPEKDIQSWLSSLGFEFNSTYKLIAPKQIDLYNADLKIAIEYCGLYWHNNKSPQPRNSRYHYDKYKACLDKGVRLFTIFSDEWVNREKQWKNLLKSALGISSLRIFARKCVIKEVDYQTGLRFFNEYHIQGGRRKSLVYFGLYYDDDLVGVVSLNKHHRNIKNHIVLDRLCFKDDVQIVGGASKLLSKCIEWSKINDYVSMISWSDNRYSQGNVYEKIGFKLDAELSPDYSYVEISGPIEERKSKQSMKGKEKDKTLMTKYGKIYDCGKKRYVITM